MTQDEIDTMWQKTMHQSIKEGEMFTRYQFARLVAAKATEEANAKANASWERICKKMVAFEREACAQVAFSWNHEITDRVAEEIRARGEQA